MIDHVSIAVKNYEESIKFYDATFPILGYDRVMTLDDHKVAGYGIQESLRPHFWIAPFGNEQEEIGNARGVHFAFVANSTQAVDAWYARCIELGATDNGKPGVRPQYHPGYYGAFVIDPNGWRLEACFHRYKAQ